ncbi:MAG TPA: hypothetical protein QGG37_00960 [Chloroflexota bacterium]|nr:hypothetical protein [Chloroflexota bacterium]
MKAADPCATLELEYAMLYDHDSGGRLAPVDRHGNPAPDLTIGRIDGAVMSRLQNDLSDDLTAELTVLAADEPVTASLEDSPRFDHEYRRLLGMGDAAAGVYVAFVLSATPVSPGLKEEQPVVATLDRAAFSEFPGLVTDLEIGRPGLTVLRDGRAVAVAFSSRSVAGVAEAGVESVPVRRSCGYAIAATAAWARVVRWLGRGGLLQRRRWQRRLAGGGPQARRLSLRGDDVLPVAGRLN